ncbi:PspC domain-containing protein [Paraglaciecola arctica]|jgi:phage shock protein PspC (stress-responsive transcriptional regulator)|uniref:PspC domain-containing protein n=1 Tax=Paraglaciecola arctica TaxID=1128911 RepID=UPI0002F85D00|nr:PspC domain-containing protein [Paraglaciecola arctica]
MKRYYEVNRLYKDPVHRKVSGVCAGLAKHWSLPRLLVRVIAVVCLISLPMVTAIAYITATVLIPNR